MPILDVEIVSDDPATPDLAQRLADAAGAVLGTERGRTWVKLRFLPQSRYAENGGLTEGISPVFVSILRGQADPGKRASVARSLASAIAEVLGRSSSSVHILFEADGRGRIAFGGELRK